MIRIDQRFLFVLSVSTLLGATAFAQPTNYGTLLGERAALIGGAYTAIADDPTASIHNPAGLYRVSAPGLSVSGNTYGIHRRTISNFVKDPANKGRDLETDSIEIIPNSLAYALPFESGGFSQAIGFSIYVPYAYNHEGHQNLSVESQGILSDVFISEQETTYWGGPSYAVKLGPVSVGLSLFAQFVQFSYKHHFATSFEIPVEGVPVEALNQSFDYIHGYAIALLPVFGMLVEPVDKLSFGLTVHAPSAHITGEAEIYAAYTTSNHIYAEDGNLLDSQQAQDVFSQIKHEARFKTPWMLSAGVAYRVTQKLKLSMDIDCYLPQPEYESIQGDVYQPLDAPDDPNRSFNATLVTSAAQLVVNGALGAQWQLSETSLLLGGLFTDLSATEADYASIIDAGERSDRYGASIGYGSFDDSSSWSIGLAGWIGTGRATSFVFDRESETRNVLTDMREWSLMVMVGGRAHFRDDKKR